MGGTQDARGQGGGGDGKGRMREGEGGRRGGEGGGEGLSHGFRPDTSAAAGCGSNAPLSPTILPQAHLWGPGALTGIKVANCTGILGSQIPGVAIL